MNHLEKRVNETVNGAIALYDPNGPAAIIAFLVFGAVAVTYWVRYFRFGKPRPKYMLPVIFGCTFMSLGYICRFSRRNGISAWSWLFETMFILLSPCAFLAQMDVLLPRLAIELGAEDCIFLNLRFFKITFILIDIVCVLTQLAGTALTITFGDLVRIGQILVTAGLWVQLVFFLLTVLVYVVFGLRVSKRRSGGWKGLHSYPTLTSITVLFLAIGLSSVFMLIRSVYRVAEYTAGADSSLAHSEVAFYLLDSIPMLLFCLTFIVVWSPQVFEDYYPSTSVDLPERNHSDKVESARHPMPQAPRPYESPRRTTPRGAVPYDTSRQATPPMSRPYESPRPMPQAYRPRQ